MKKWNNEEGSILVALSLIIALITAVVFMLNLHLLVTSSDVILRNGTSLAVKAAANHLEIVSGPAQDNNDRLLINFDRAKDSFESILKSNLELDNSFEPQNFSPFIGKPNYTLLIYNGQRNRNIPPGIIYNYQDGRITENRINQGGFPRAFMVSDGIEVAFESPGVVAVVEAAPKLISKERNPCSRWAAATLVQDQNDNWIAVLQKSREI